MASKSARDPQEPSPPLAFAAEKKRVTKTKRAEILFPVARVLNQMKAGRYAKTIQNGSAVYMAAVLEYISAELLEVSRDVARQNKRHRINPRHVNMAVRNDAELNELLKDVTITQGGVVPFIHGVLLPKSARKRKSSVTQSEEFTSSKKPSMEEEVDEGLQDDSD